MYDLLAVDLDGTSLNSQGILSQRNVDALDRLRNAGVRVVFSSGRATRSIVPHARRVVPESPDEYLIAFNGARTTRMDGTLVHAAHLTAEVARYILDYAERAGLLTITYDPDSVVAAPRSKAQLARLYQYASWTRLDLRIVEDFAATIIDGVPKIFIIGSPEELAAHWSSLRTGDGWRGTRSGETNIEVVAPGVDKGSALRMLGASLGIEPSAMAAVGDNINDIEMIETVGLGCAVANAHESVRARADHLLTSSCDEDAMVELAELILEARR